MLYERDVLKNFSKFIDKIKKQSSGRALSKDVLRNLPNSPKNIIAGNCFFIKLQATRLETETIRSSHWRFSVK